MIASRRRRQIDRAGTHSNTRFAPSNAEGPSTVRPWCDVKA